MIHNPTAPTAPGISQCDAGIHALLDLMALRDPQLLAHSFAVARVAARVASEVGLVPDEVDRVRCAALVHDCGKLALPFWVIRKPGRLTPAEYALVRRHPYASYRMARNAGLQREARWVLHHHEQPDGGGYPHRLVDREIPLESDIIHVADVYDALISDRPYRNAMSRAQALAEIVDGSGREFNRDCVSALVQATARPFC